MAKAPRRKFRHLPAIAFAILATFLGVGVFSYVRGLISGAPTPTKKVVQEIHVIRPPPPPPDEPPPPPPPPEEKVNVPDPQNKPDPTPTNEPPPSEHLGLDAEGGAGGDAFGLVGNKGGRELVGGGGGNAYVWYAGLLKSEITDALQTESSARSGGYSVIVRVWVRPDGTIERVHIVQGSGDHKRDQMIEGALSRITRLSQAPPADMPEPISLRIVSRG
jgi:periplasmic protein TonB